MTKAVAILGSPKPTAQSATGKQVTDLFERLRAAVPGLETQIISLAEADVRGCTGCLTCQRTGRCVHDDEMPQIRERLAEADLIVYASPVHISHVSALFQNFFSRMLTGLHTFEFIGIPSISVITANGSGEQDAEKYLGKMALLLGNVSLGSVIRLDNDPFDEKRYIRVVAAAADVLTGNRALKPTLGNRLYFASMRSIIFKNPQYFSYETGVWEEQGWRTGGFARAAANAGDSARG